MLRLFLVSVALVGSMVGGTAQACPLTSVGASSVEVVAVPTLGVAVVETVVPQVVLEAQGHCAVASEAVVIAARPRVALRSRLLPLRASSRVTVRTRVW